MAIDVFQGLDLLEENNVLPVLDPEPELPDCVRKVMRDLQGCLNHLIFLIDYKSGLEFKLYLTSVYKDNGSLALSFCTDVRTVNIDSTAPSGAFFDCALSFADDGTVAEISLSNVSDDWSEIITKDCVLAYFSRMYVSLNKTSSS